MDSGTILMPFSLSQSGDLLEAILSCIRDMIKIYPHTTNSMDMTPMGRNLNLNHQVEVDDCLILQGRVQHF